jgi:hypothetical protein
MFANARVVVLALRTVAKNGSRLAILFQNSALTLRRLPVDCAIGFFAKHLLKKDKKIWQ